MNKNEYIAEIARLTKMLDIHHGWKGEPLLGEKALTMVESCYCGYRKPAPVVPDKPDWWQQWYSEWSPVLPVPNVLPQSITQAVVAKLSEEVKRLNQCLKCTSNIECDHAGEMTDCLHYYPKTRRRAIE